MLSSACCLQVKRHVIVESDPYSGNCRIRDVLYSTELRPELPLLLPSLTPWDSRPFLKILTVPHSMQEALMACVSLSEVLRL